MNINIISASLPPPIGAGHDNERIITKYDYDDLLSMGWMWLPPPRVQCHYLNPIVITFSWMEKSLSRIPLLNESSDPLWWCTNSSLTRGWDQIFFQFTNLHPTPCSCAWKEIYLYWMKILILWSRYRRHIVQIKLAIKYLVMANYPKILHFCNPEQYCLSKTIQLIDIVCENQYTGTV